ncbi:MAG: DUF4129 domain-containing protein [Gammaproteobacteria bacterium]|nr:DUF4129 domain-containing protein [Gammaproteobacteria bacterium]
MDLSKISIKLRPRNGYAAIDLGTRMAQKNWKLMVMAAIIFTLPLFVLLIALMPNHPIWAIFIVWWLKPLWERPLLLILSQDVFHQSLTLADVVKHGFKLLFKQLIPSITWRRFSPTRSFDAPVMQLENLSGAARRERLTALHSRSPSSISGMTIMMHLVEELIAFGLMLFILQFLPINDVEWTIFLENMVTNTGLDLYYLLLAIGWYIAMLLIAPFYVAGGFSSYLNQRSIREAWDLELVFRQLASKHKPKKFDYQNIVAVLLVSLVAFTTPTIDAAEESKSDPYAQHKLETKRAIEKIQSSPDYKRTEKTSKLRRINPLESNKDTEREEKSGSKDLFGKGLGEVLSWLFIIALIVFLLFKLPVIIEYFQAGSRTKNEKLGNKKKPEQLFGLDLKQETLPDDIVQESIALWQAGKHREALGLLYRASLSKLIHEYHCDFEDGFTELECQKIVEQMQLPLAQYFAELTETWRLLAYGHKLPTEANFRALAEQWPNYFEAEPNNNQAEFANG